MEEKLKFLQVFVEVFKMFIELLTTKQEKIAINVNRIEFFTSTKKGTLIVFTDGLDVEVPYEYEVVIRLLHEHSNFILLQRQKYLI